MCDCVDEAGYELWDLNPRPGAANAMTYEATAYGELPRAIR